MTKRTPGRPRRLPANDTVQIVIKMDGATFRALDRLAARDERTPAAQIRWLIKQQIEGEVTDNGNP